MPSCLTRGRSEFVYFPGMIRIPEGSAPDFKNKSWTDIVPTIYEAAKVTPPKVLDGVEQKPLDGVSLVYTFDNATAPTQHGTQYFEMFGNRAIYKG